MNNEETYKTILENKNILSEEILKLKKLGISKLSNFISTVEGYTMYLDNYVKLNQDAEEAIKDIQL